VTPSSLCPAAAYRSPKRTPLAGEGKPGKKLGPEKGKKK